MEQLFNWAAPLCDSAVFTFMRKPSDVFSSDASNLQCMTALSECFEELLKVYEEIQSLYASEILMGMNAVTTIGEADKTAADSIEQG